MTDVPDRVYAAVTSIPRPRAAGDNALREWACTYVSRLLGREIRGGWAVDTLVAKLEESK